MREPVGAGAHSAAPWVRGSSLPSPAASNTLGQVAANSEQGLSIRPLRKTSEECSLTDIPAEARMCPGLRGSCVPMGLARYKTEA